MNKIKFIKKFVSFLKGPFNYLIRTIRNLYYSIKLIPYLSNHLLTMSNPLPSPHRHPAYLHLLKSFQGTKTHLSVANLNNPLLEKNPEVLTYFLQRFTRKLQATKNLKSLTLDLRGIQIGWTNIEDIKKYLLKNLRDIQNLKIIFCPASNLSPEYFDIFLEALECFKNLRTIEVTFSKIYTFAYMKWSITHLIKALKKSAPRLQHAKFAILEEAFLYRSLSFPSLQNWGLKRLAYLQSLTLPLPSSAFLENQIDPISKLDLSALKRFKRLNSLDITLVELPPDFREVISEELAFDPKKFFPNLKSFRCGASYIHPSSSQGLEFCASKIASRLHLEDFGLRFKQSSELTDEEIQRTTQCLASLEIDLTHLSLLFRFGKLAAHGMNALIAAFSSSRLSNLHQLSLEFFECKGINNGFVTKLGETFAQNMNELKALRLRFDNCGSSSSPFVKGLLGVVGKKLEGLTDRGISNLGESLLKGCRNLEFVWLVFGECSQISDQGVKDLCESLRKIESLKRIWLQFRLCSEVSGVCEQYALEKLGNIKEIKFARR